MTTNSKRITGLLGFALSYAGYEYLSHFQESSIANLRFMMESLLSHVVTYNHSISILWLTVTSILCFCWLFGLGRSELYGIWCVIRAILRLPFDIICFFFKKNPTR